MTERGGTDSVPAQPQITPDTVARASVEHSFVLQGVFDLKGAVSGIEVEVRILGEKLDAVSASTSAIQAKIEGLTTWKNAIVVGTAVVVALVIGLVGVAVYAVDKIADRITFTVPAGQAQPASAPAPQRPASK